MGGAVTRLAVPDRWLNVFLAKGGGECVEIFESQAEALENIADAGSGWTYLHSIHETGDTATLHDLADMAREYDDERNEEGRYWERRAFGYSVTGR